MSEISQRYARLAADFAAKVAAVPADRWADPSPCEGWTALDVVRHVVVTPNMFLAHVRRQLGEIPSVDDDPAAAWEAVRNCLQSDLEDPTRAGEAYEGFFGRTTFQETVDRFLCIELLVHGWDLARAAGLDERLDAAEVQRQLELTPTFGESLRAPGICGPELPPPEDADDQTRLLLFLGRQVDPATVLEK